MNRDLFERLLYEEESPTLDFKIQQYKFAKASEDDKSELLKDILGFANAWRRSEAYILIGVEDIRGGRGNVVGIPAEDHLDDHSLQQFVNNLTSQPVRFHYEAFGFEGKHVGIICIEEQTRPFYLRRDYGKLKKDKVYVRRGSSTDPTKPATLEEIAQMRIGSSQPAADLLVEFAHLEKDEPLGTDLSLNSEYCEMPSAETIPDLTVSRPQHPFLSSLANIDLDPLNHLNKDFYRELADFEFIRRMFRPVRLVVMNIGQVAAINVRAEVSIPRDSKMCVMDESEIPSRPKRKFDISRNIRPVDFRSANRRDPGTVSIDKNNDRQRIEIDCYDLQPGRRVWSDIFYVGMGASGNYSLKGSLLADNLPRPQDFELSLSVSVTETRMAVDDLCSKVSGGSEKY